MATTTPNFGWTVPTSSDLVKDGAVAIETLGDAIDASLLDLKGGTTGQILAKASGTNMDFSWVTPTSGGKIAQVVFASTATETSTTSTSYVDATNLTASITPSAASSKVLILSTTGVTSNGAAFSNASVQLVRGSSTSIADFGSNKVYAGGAFTQNFDVVGMNWLDSPSTTSATTYKVQFKTQSGLTAWVNRTAENLVSSIILLEVLA